VSGVAWVPPGFIERLVYAAPYLYVACSDAGVCILESTAVAIDEPKQVEEEQARKGASVVRGVLFLPEARNEKREARSELRDISGRKVADLHPGANDVRALAPGVYFVRPVSGAEREAPGVTKVVVTR
jgi:hypothetical protein